MPDGQGAAPAAPTRHHAMAPRRGIPGEELAEQDVRGETVSVTADADGVIRPETLDQVALCDRLGLEVIRDDELAAVPVDAPAPKKGGRRPSITDSPATEAGADPAKED